jgi:tetratricopeptide (TPR) repeat protein
MNLTPKYPEYYAEIKKYSRILKAFPGNTHFLALRANSHFWHAAWKKAANDYERLSKVYPANKMYWGLLGQACVHGRMPEKAIAACTRGIELDPDLEYFYMHRAWAYRQLRQWDASIADYTKARELDLINRGTMHSTMYRGELYLEMKNYEKAVRDFTLAIHGSPFWHKLYRLRGIAHMKMKQYEKVIENANAFMDINQNAEIVLLKQRAVACKKLEKFDQAEADFAHIKRLKLKVQNPAYLNSESDFI